MSSDANVAMLSIDVEDWFHLVGAGLDYQFKGHALGTDSWSQYSSRVQGNIEWILDQLEVHQTKATFFILGWVAENNPQVVKKIYARGHEIASHGFWHKIVAHQTPSDFKSDMNRSVEVLEQTTGEKVLGYRASSASIQPWMFDLIAEAGLIYDSSYFPVSYHDVYGCVEGMSPSRGIERLPNGLWEVKFSSLAIGKALLPWSGGGYFRLLPYGLFRWGAKHIQDSTQCFQFYAHPWEFDPEAPRLENLKSRYYWRRYVGLTHTCARFRKLLVDFRFIPIRQALKELDPQFVFTNADSVIMGDEG